MAEIRPFRAVRYNQSLIGDLASVICPPYDIISPQMQQELYQRSPYNFVRLEYSQELPHDTDTNNKYTRAAATLEQWLKQGILKIDAEPAIYLHDQYFTHQGREYRRRSLIVVVRLEEWHKMVVRPHEGTLSAPKSDRLNLYWQLQANTSSIMALYEDPGREVAVLLAAQEKAKPILNINNINGGKHIVRGITDSDIVNQIRSHLAEQPLYIADGHHRYESALNYRRERRACSPALIGEQPFDFVMMTLIEFSDPRLVILPAHRLVGGLPGSALAEFVPKLRTFFEIEEVPLNKSNMGHQVDSLLATGTAPLRLVLFGPGKEQFLVLRLRDLAAASQLMPYFHSEIYKRLEVSIVDHVVLERLLGLDHNQAEAFLSYSYDTVEAINKVLRGECQLAFLLNPVKTAVIKAIADVSDRMPRKSTYFYPKLPSGLVFYRFV